MNILEKLIETESDLKKKRALKYARYLYGDLVTDENRELLDEYTDALMDALRSTRKSDVSERKIRSDVLQSFYDYLIRTGKTENTSYDYTKRVERICKEFGIDVNDLYHRQSNYSIDDLIGMYECGAKAEENKEKHNAPLSALKRFKDYMNQIISDKFDNDKD